jgi:uncharacterized DUF497 family protein
MQAIFEAIVNAVDLAEDDKIRIVSIRLMTRQERKICEEGEGHGDG